MVGISGSLPESFEELTNLEELNLYDNQLSGPIPESMGKLTKLKTLYLSENILNGPIPESLGKLTNLRFVLCIGDNTMTNKCINRCDIINNKNYGKCIWC
ncbi:hypothetical protein PIROE2DRAFT_4633 [Piromyces sp. E2]|nr:hypothetical protein PIROE2DRAFT_4633 [Piromyces sp. E2]|eukprot:OUM67823.1 hypothetical protein PIROE2DRAFT_4633 [Piromyces sp. E2]